MRTTKVIYADEGKILTNGEIYGRVIFLAEGESDSDYYEISKAEYEAIVEENASNMTQYY